MNRLSLTTALCALFPFAAQAEDILIRADIVSATVYGAGANVTRAGLAELPAGRHRLLIAVPDIHAAELPQIRGSEALRFGPPQVIDGHPVPEGALDTGVQARARATMEAAEEALRATQDRLTLADAAIRGIETQQGYIAAILRGGENGVGMPADPALVPQFLATLGEQTARLADEMLAAQVGRRELVEAVEDAQRVLVEATQAFHALAPFGPASGVIAVDVTVPEPVAAEIALDYFTREAAWRPSYELDLNSTGGILAIDRFVTLQTWGAARWQDVAVTFSTSSPDRLREPSEAYSTPARLIDPVALAREQAATVHPVPQPGIAQYGIGNAPALIGGFADAGRIVAEPVAIVAAGPVAQFEGLSVSYPYPVPVSVGPTGETLLSFDTLELQAETENRAVPRWDDTAFLVATSQNDSGEPILPGAARFYRDGALVGEGHLPLIPAGGETELGFGALDHLQLVWIDRSLDEGDRGIFTTSTTQTRALAFGIENTGSEPAVVRVIHATPFAEQQDLDLTVGFDRQPDARDIDDLRGVHAWEITVAPGAEERVEMRVDFEFPEGQILDWQP